MNFHFCHAKSARKHRRKGHYVVFAFWSIHGHPVYKWAREVE